MVFIYYSQGVASQYQDFTERLMSHLALKGTEITQQVLKETTATDACQTYRRAGTA